MIKTDIMAANTAGTPPRKKSFDYAAGASEYEGYYGPEESWEGWEGSHEYAAGYLDGPAYYESYGPYSGGEAHPEWESVEIDFFSMVFTLDAKLEPEDLYDAFELDERGFFFVLEDGDIVEQSPAAWKAPALKIHPEPAARKQGAGAQASPAAPNPGGSPLQAAKSAPGARTSTNSVTDGAATAGGESENGSSPKIIISESQLEHLKQRMQDLKNKRGIGGMALPPSQAEARRTGDDAGAAAPRKDPVTPQRSPQKPSKATPLQNCPAQHGLSAFLTPDDGWWCSICVKEHDKGSSFFGCRKCDYDACEKCALTAPAKRKTPEPSAPPPQASSASENYSVSPDPGAVTRRSRREQKTAAAREATPTRIVTTTARRSSRRVGKATASAPERGGRDHDWRERDRGRGRGSSEERGDDGQLSREEEEEEEDDEDEEEEDDDEVPESPRSKAGRRTSTRDSNLVPRDKVGRSGRDRRDKSMKPRRTAEAASAKKRAAERARPQKRARRPRESDVSSGDEASPKRAVSPPAKRSKDTPKGRGSTGSSGVRLTRAAQTGVGSRRSSGGAKGDSAAASASASAAARVTSRADAAGDAAGREGSSSAGRNRTATSGDSSARANNSRGGGRGDSNDFLRRVLQTNSFLQSGSKRHGLVPGTKVSNGTGNEPRATLVPPSRKDNSEDPGSPDPKSGGGGAFLRPPKARAAEAGSSTNRVRKTLANDMLSQLQRKSRRV